MITLFIRGLPRSSTEEAVAELFASYGSVHSVKLVKDIFSGECKGFATVQMEGHEGRAAMQALDGSVFNGSSIGVRLERPQKGRGGRRR